MNCYQHPDEVAVGYCTSCNQPICLNCRVEMQGKLVCRDCLASGKAKVPAQVPAGVSGAKDPNTAYLLEFVPGIFGILGLGHLYVGNTSDGVLRLIFWLMFVIAEGLVLGLFSGLTMGIGFCIGGPIVLAIDIVVPLLSAQNLKNRMMNPPN